MNISYRSINNLNTDILNNLHKIPHDIDLIVGVPRSGMLPANLLALYLNKQYTDIDSFLDGRVYDTGDRGTYIEKGRRKKILIVDDSLNTGSALRKVKNKIAKSHIDIESYDIKYCVIYSNSISKKLVDIYCTIIDGPRVFQWNIFHHKEFVNKACYDIDGVLCPNPPIDDDGPQYLEYIKNAPLLYKPTHKIDTIISCRLEKYRKVTEEWLKDNEIEYNTLHMLPFTTKEERIKWGKHGEYKGGIYKNSNNILFVESSMWEAKDIVRISHKPVFCTETFSMLNDERISSVVSSKFQVHKTLLIVKLAKLKNNAFKILGC